MVTKAPLTENSMVSGTKYIQPRSNFQDIEKDLQNAIGKTKSMKLEGHLTSCSRTDKEASKQKKLKLLITGPCSF